MDISKQTLEQTLHRRLLWHEYSDKGEYICGNVFNDSDPIEVMTSYSSSDWKMHAYVKCAGTNEMVPLSSFANGNQCLHCPERSLPGLLACTADNHARFAWDLTSDNAMSSGPANQIVVPAGCPHAQNVCVRATDEDMTFEFSESKYYASAVICSEHGKNIVPYSWKIVKNNDKLTLSIQYRTRYFNYRKMNTVQHSMYCHICCNLKNGQTHISDIHSQDAGRRRTGIFKAPMETLTFTGESELLLYMPEHNELHTALSALYDVLNKELKLQGYDCVAPLYSMPHTWQVQFPNELSHKNSEDILYSIALLNRFPNLGCFPLPKEYRDIVALYIKRRFDKLPRNTSAQSLIEDLGLEKTPLLTQYVWSHPSYAFLAVMLDEWGFDAKDIEGFAGHDFARVFDVLKALITRQTKHRKTYQMFDMLSIAAPAMLLFPDTASRSLESLLSGVVGNDINELMSKMATTSFKEHARPLQKFKKTWHTDYETFSSHWNRPDIGCTTKVSVRSANDAIQHVSVLGTWYLDRRAWNKKEARKYVQVLKECAKQGDARLSTVGENLHIGELFQRASRFSFSVFYLVVHSYTNEECRLFYEWAYKNDIEVLLNVDTAYFYVDNMGKKARKNIEERIEKKRKAKRDAKAKK